MESPENIDVTIDLSYVYFESPGYYDYPDGPGGSRSFINTSRLVKIEPLYMENDIYSLSILEVNDVPSIWGSAAVMKPLLMKIKNRKDNMVHFSCNGEKSTEVMLFHDGPEVERIVFNQLQPFRYIEYCR